MELCERLDRHAKIGWIDPVIEAYKKDVDRTLIRENLRLTVDQRLQNLEALLRGALEMRRAMRATHTVR